MYLYNAIRTPDGTIIESRHRHDFVTHKDLNGKTYSVDGGEAYLRRVAEEMDYEDLSIEDNGDHSLRRKHLVWGKNYDKDMNRLPKTIFIPIMDMTTEHIKAIIDGGHCKSGVYYEIFIEELKLRGDE